MADHNRIGDQWAFYPTGEVQDHMFFTADDSRLPYSRTSYYHDGQVSRKTIIDSNPEGSEKITSYWPDGKTNTIIIGGKSIDHRAFEQAYDRDGNALLDDKGNGEVQYVSVSARLGVRVAYADVENGRFTTREIRKRKDVLQ